MARVYARVAVDGVPPEADRLYDYALTPQQEGLILPGMRVIVPFGRGNRRHEAMVVELTGSTALSSVKSVENRIDEVPVLDDALLRLALHMRARLCCPFYAVVRAMLPAGLWYRREERYVLADPDAQGRDEMEQAVLAELKTLPDAGHAALARLADEQTIERLVRRGVLEKQASFLPAAKEKKTAAYRLTEEGLAYDPSALSASRSPARSAVLEFLRGSGTADSREIGYYTGASPSVLAGLVRSGLIERTQRRVWRRPDAGIWQPVDIILNEEQLQATQGLCALADRPGEHTALLFGVTGSGKTEVYINLIHHILEQGGQALVLVPEIALTPQLTARFVYEFGERVAVLHSALALGERYDEWSRIRAGAVDVVVGTRSAVFAPLGALKLIIIDEEHEPTFSSDADPRYDARDVALYRARETGALVLLGSATPSLDTAYRAKTGSYAYFELTRRARQAALAEVEVSDRREAYRRGFKGEIGPELALRLQETLARGEQAILFLNRRGTSRALRCLSCGHIPMCANCSSPLSYHRESERMLCHICGYSEPKPLRCPECGQTHLERIGSGTQAVEQALLQAFPDIRVLRMDSDTTQSAASHETILASFASGEADVLVGTQMIAKGLDFPNVTLSAVVDADMSLYTGDFRAAERSFSLFTQVVGRSGRAEKPGFSVIQTASPDNDVIRAAARQDYWAFYASEIRLREQLRYPPFLALARMTFSAPIEADALEGAQRMAQLLGGYLGGSFSDLEMEILGPAPAPVVRMNRQFYYTLYIKYTPSRRQRTLLSGALQQFREDKRNRKIRVSYDIHL